MPCTPVCTVVHSYYGTRGYKYDALTSCVHSGGGCKVGSKITEPLYLCHLPDSHSRTARHYTRSYTSHASTCTKCDRSHIGCDAHSVLQNACGSARGGLISTPRPFGRKGRSSEKYDTDTIRVRMRIKTCSFIARGADLNLPLSNPLSFHNCTLARVTPCSRQSRAAPEP
jgi:hypothetical protein